MMEKLREYDSVALASMCINGVYVYDIVYSINGWDESEELMTVRMLPENKAVICVPLENIQTLTLVTKDDDDNETRIRVI